MDGTVLENDVGKAAPLVRMILRGPVHIGRRLDYRYCRCYDVKTGEE